MEPDFTAEEIAENRPSYSDGSKTQLSTGEFILYRALEVATAIVCSPFIILAIIIVLSQDGVPSYTELKNAAVDFATDRSPPRNMCAHDWEFTRGTQGNADPLVLREDGLYYRVYDSLRYECPHCGEFEWVHANETVRVIEPSDEST